MLQQQFAELTLRREIFHCFHTTIAKRTLSLTNIGFCADRNMVGMCCMIATLASLSRWFIHEISIQKYRSPTIEAKDSPMNFAFDSDANTSPSTPGMICHCACPLTCEIVTLQVWRKNTSLFHNLPEFQLQTMIRNAKVGSLRCLTSILQLIEPTGTFINWFSRRCHFSADCLGRR